MRNPARDLLDLIDSWDTASSLVVRRGSGNNTETDLQFWEAQKRAARLLSEVEQFLREDGTYEEDAPALVDAWVFLFPPRDDWCTATDSLPQLSGALRMTFRQIARRIDEQSVPVTELTPETIESLRQTLLEVREQVRVLAQLAPEERDRLLDLVRHALWLIDNEDTQPEDIRTATCEVVGALLPVVTLVPEEQRESFFSRLLHMAGTWVGDVTAGAAGALLANVTPTAIDAASHLLGH